MYIVKSHIQRRTSVRVTREEAAQHPQQILGVGASSFDLRAVTVFN